MNRKRQWCHYDQYQIREGSGVVTQNTAILFWHLLFLTDLQFFNILCVYTIILQLQLLIQPQVLQKSPLFPSQTLGCRLRILVHILLCRICRFVKLYSFDVVGFKQNKLLHKMLRIVCPFLECSV